MSVTVLICIGISDLSVSGGGHRCHLGHHFMEGGSRSVVGHAHLLPCLWWEPKEVLRYLGDGGDRGGGGAAHGGSEAQEPI